LYTHIHAKYDDPQKDEVLDYYSPNSLSLAGSGRLSLTSGKVDFQALLSRCTEHWFKDYISPKSCLLLQNRV